MMSASGLSDEVMARFCHALRGVANTVTVITAHDGDRHHGMTATAVMSVSMDPPSLAVCLNRATLLHDIVTRSRRFCVNILDEDQETVSAAFSGAMPATERFRLGRWLYDGQGLGWLADAQASLFCRRTAALPYGTHTLFIGEIEDVRFGARQSPLIYQNGSYGRSIAHAG